MPAAYVNDYGVITLEEFREKAYYVDIIWKYITVDSWNVTNIKVSNKFSINGDVPTDNYCAYINGSLLIGYDCNIIGNLSIASNTKLNNVEVFGDMTNYGKININDANVSYLSVSIMNVSEDITILGDASIYQLNVLQKSNLFGNTNISNAYIKNMNVTGNTSLYGANISGITNISNLYVQIGTNLSGTTNISTANIRNMTTYGEVTMNGVNLSSITNISYASVKDLNVFGNTSLQGATVAGNINTSNIYVNNIFVNNLTANNKAFLNNGLDINASAVTANGGLVVNSLDTNNLLVGGDTRKDYCSVFYGKIYAAEIVCPKPVVQNASGGQTSTLDNAAVSIYSKTNTYNPNVFYLLAGFTSTNQTYVNITDTAPIMFNCYAQGSFIYGLTKFGGNDSTFDISANAALSGITYNGPINIGKSFLSDFNVSANNIRFGGGNMTLVNDLLIGGNITSTSDKRLKENITPLSDCLTKIKKIRGYSFTRNDLEDKNKKYLGLLAQEVEEVFPDLVTESNNTKSINYQSFVAVLLECIKELNAKLENKILS